MSKLHVPDGFQTFFESHERTRMQMKERVKRMRKATVRKQVALEKIAQRNSSKNLRYAKKVFAWAKAFNASEIGRRALESIPAHYRTHNRGIAIFKWKGSYSLSTSPVGVRWYRFGPGSKEKQCTSPEELACVYPYDLLPAAAKAIKTGEVWDWIKDDLSLFTKKEE